MTKWILENTWDGFRLPVDQAEIEDALLEAGLGFVSVTEVNENE